MVNLFDEDYISIRYVHSSIEDSILIVYKSISCDECATNCDINVSTIYSLLAKLNKISTLIVQICY